MPGTQYRYGGLACGCVRCLTGPEVSAADPEAPTAGCIRGDSKPKRQLVLWVALPGVRVRSHRCGDGPPPPPPGSYLPELPAVLEIVRDASGNPLRANDLVVCLGTGGQIRYTVQELQEDRILATNGRRILPSAIVRADCYTPFLLGSAS
jgi:hypothetical protein